MRWFKQHLELSFLIALLIVVIIATGFVVLYTNPGILVSVIYSYVGTLALFVAGWVFGENNGVLWWLLFWQAPFYLENCNVKSK